MFEGVQDTQHSRLNSILPEFHRLDFLTWEGSLFGMLFLPITSYDLSCLGGIETTLPNTGCCSIRTLLVLQLLLKFSKLLQCDLLLLIKDLSDSLNLFDLGPVDPS